MESILKTHFPLLTDTDFEITSNATTQYNCIAWAAEDDTTFWWPDSKNQSYWPTGVIRTETLEAFIDAYATLGYIMCDNSKLEPKHSKNCNLHKKWNSVSCG